MNRKDRIVLQKICDYIASVIRYCRDYSSFEMFSDNSMLVEACVFDIMQIGELSKSALSDDIKMQLYTIPWKQIYGMRNRIVHGYDGVQLNIVWDTVKNDLPALEKEIETFLKAVKD